MAPVRVSVGYLPNSGKPYTKYPLTVQLPEQVTGILALEEAEDLIDQLEDAIEEVEEARESHVQVNYSLSDFGMKYTYRDPSGALQVGDLVEVPVNYGTKVGKVVALGRGSWKGVVKDVTGRLERKPL